MLKVHGAQTSSSLNERLQTELSSLFNLEISVVGLEEISEETIPPRAIVVSTIEAVEPLLSTISGKDLERVQLLTNKASKIMWITNGNLVSGSRPDHALVRGIAGPLLLEQPALKLQIFDIDDPVSDVDVTAQNVTHAVKHLFSKTVHEPELAQQDGTVHALRWEPENVLNEQFDLKQNEGITEMTLGDVGRAELSIKEPGQMETIHFAVKEFQAPLAADHVEIQVKSVGINAKVILLLYPRNNPV